MSTHNKLCLLLTLTLTLAIAASSLASAGDGFVDSVAPILERRCLSCHNDQKTEGDLSIVDPKRLVDDGYVEAFDAAQSHLLELISPRDGRAEMPKDADPLKEEEITVIMKWIDGGAGIPDAFRLQPPTIADRDWWSLQPIKPLDKDLDSRWVDDRIEAMLARKGLTPLSAADPLTLIRRIFYDLSGLPPTPEQIDRFVTVYGHDPDSAWQGLVDRLLEAPEFGEKWGQHWLDLARYAETHGYDKDQPRNNAWPYRDYVIQSLNADKPFGDFVGEQIAGDVLAADHAEGIIATGFLAAGPWDLIAHKEVGEGKLDGRIAKHLDRDEMATAVFNVFQSTTIQCAQCHNHKFDPIQSEDYYRVQAIFAGIDRADRVYAGLSDQQQAEKKLLEDERAAIVAQRDQAQKEFEQTVGKQTRTIDSRIESLNEKANAFPPPTEHGFHSTIAPRADQSKWVEVDLGAPTSLDRITLVACYDDFNNIGSGFGFPVRFKVEVTAENDFSSDHARLLFDRTETDFTNPQSSPVEIKADEKPIRIIRVTATKLAERRHDFILALGELIAIDTKRGTDVARNVRVAASDHIPPNSRWSPKYLVDGKYHRLALGKAETAELKQLHEQRQAIVDSIRSPQYARDIEHWNRRITAIEGQLGTFPDGKLVYAAASDFESSGNFKPTQGKVREIRFLHRGDLKSPGDRMLPGAPDFGPKLRHGSSRKRSMMNRKRGRLWPSTLPDATTRYCGDRSQIGSGNGRWVNRWWGRRTISEEWGQNPLTRRFWTLWPHDCGTTRISRSNQSCVCWCQLARTAALPFRPTLDR